MALTEQTDFLWAEPGKEPLWSWPTLVGAAVFGAAATLLVGWSTGLWPAAIIFAIFLCSGLASLLVKQARSVRVLSDVIVQDAAHSYQLAHLLTHLPTAAVLTNNSGNIISANVSYAQLVSNCPPPLDLARSAEDQAAIRYVIAEARTGTPTDAEISIGTMRKIVNCEKLSNDVFLWQFKDTSETLVLGAHVASIEGALGDILGERGIAVLVANLQGRILGTSGQIPVGEGIQQDKIIGTLLAEWMSYQNGLLSWSVNGESPYAIEVHECTLKTEHDTEAGILIAFSTALRTDDVQAGDKVTADRAPPPFVDSLPLPLALTDRDGRLLYFNKLFAQSVGLENQSSAPTQYPSDLVTDEDRIALSDLVRRVGSGISQKQTAIVHLRAQKDEPIQLTVMPIGKGSARAGSIATVITLSDNAERRKLEQQVAQAQKMQGIGQLAGGIAHDFNNILTAISGFCELLLQRHPPGDPSFSDINQVLTNSNRAAALVKQLLAFSRQQTLRPVTVHITDLLTEQLITLKRLIGEGVRLDVQHGRDIGSVRVDPTQFYQVVMNLVVNARDAMPVGGKIGIRTFAVDLTKLPKAHADLLESQDYVGIEVSDSGSGIPEDVLPKIFEPFFTTKEIGKGTGLGLSTAYGIIKQSNGFIFADSVRGQGTTFSIYLPSFQTALAIDTLAPKKLEIVDDLWGSGTILLVEDEDAVRAFAVKALERKGYKVLDADSGETALEILTENLHQIDLIVSDVVMPNMDGPAMARAALKMRPDVPIIFVSGYAEETLRQSLTDVMDTANVSFLPKPFSLKELARSVKTVMDSRAKN